jgi:hypothetical protein
MASADEARTVPLRRAYRRVPIHSLAALILLIAIACFSGFRFAALGTERAAIRHQKEQARELLAEAFAKAEVLDVFDLREQYSGVHELAPVCRRRDPDGWKWFVEEVRGAKLAGGASTTATLGVRLCVPGKIIAEGVADPLSGRLSFGPDVGYADVIVGPPLLSVLRAAARAKVPWEVIPLSSGC